MHEGCLEDCFIGKGKPFTRVKTHGECPFVNPVLGNTNVGPGRMYTISHLDGLIKDNEIGRIVADETYYLITMNSDFGM